jgi:hypothetical protein
VLECQELREFSGSRFPDRFRATEIAMLLEEGNSQTGLLRHCTFGWFLCSGNHPEKRCLPAPIATKDCPPVALADREGHSFEYFRCAKLDTSVRD